MRVLCGCICSRVLFVKIRFKIGERAKKKAGSYPARNVLSVNSVLALYLIPALSGWWSFLYYIFFER